MPAAVRLREDYSGQELRALARRSQDVSQSRRLLSLAAVRDGMDRGSAAKIGGMDRQTLRDWVHRFNASGPDGLIVYLNALRGILAYQRGPLRKRQLGGNIPSDGRNRRRHKSRENG